MIRIFFIETFKYKNINVANCNGNFVCSATSETKCKKIGSTTIKHILYVVTKIMKV